MALGVTERDYVAEVEAILDASRPEGDWQAARLAGETVGRLRAEDPDLLAGYLDAVAEAVFRQQFQLRSHRRRVNARRSVAAVAVDALESGDPGLAQTFLMSDYVVDDRHTRRRMADMTGEDHRYVAESYGASERRASLLKQFHLVLAERVGPRRTADVLSEADVRALYLQLGL